MSFSRCRATILSLSLLASSSAFGAAFTPGNIVVYRVGDGTTVTAGAAAPVFLDEFTTAGTLVQSIAMPTADNGANQTLTNTTNGTSVGLLTRSTDGNYLIAAGFDAAPGTTGVVATTAAAVNRIIARIGTNGVPDTTTRLDASYNSDNIRGAASVDGSAFWTSGTSGAGGTGGVWYTTLGALGGTQVASAANNLRGINIFDGQLYVSSGAAGFRLATVGTGLPITAGQAVTNLPGYPTASESPYPFFFADLSAAVAGVDTLYVANDDATGLKKWSLVGGTWTANGNITGTAYRGITGTVAGSSVTLYATRNNNQIVTLVDSSGYNGAFAGTPTQIGTNAAANTVYRGIAFAPGAVVPPTPALSAGDIALPEGTACVSTNFDFPITASVAPTSDLTFNFISSDGTATASGPNADYTAVPAGTGTILANQTSGTARVLVTCDGTDEPDETFRINLQAGSGYTVAQSQGVATIQNDDAVVNNLAITDVNVAEGNSGSTTFTFTVSLSQPATGTVEFDIATANGSATAGSDYIQRQFVDQQITTGNQQYTFAVTVIGDLANESDETFQVNLTNVTGVSGTVDDQAIGTIQNDDAPDVTIAAIQGNGALAALTGSQITRGNVVTALIPNGFFMQMPVGDGNPFTSDGIFVFTGSAPAVAVGDIVEVKGNVVEFGSGAATQKVTEFSGGPLVVNILASGAPLPAPIVFDANTPSPSTATPSCVGAGSTIATTDQVNNQNFECFESMLVTTTSGVVTAPNQRFGTDPLAEMWMTTAGSRSLREPGIRYDVAGEIPPALTPAAPPLPASPIWDGNPDVFELDADKLLGQSNPNILVPGTRFSATGVLGYEFNGFELWPSTLVPDAGAPTLPVAVPVQGSDQLTIASLNLLRLFNDVNDPGAYDDCATQGSSDVCPTTATFNDNLAKRSAYIRNVLRTPMVLGISECENLATLTSLAQKLNGDLAGAHTYTALMGSDDDNDPGHINSGFLVREDVTVDATAQFRTTDTFSFNGAVAGLVFDRPPFMLRATTSVGGSPLSFAVLANHLRSLGGIDTITPIATQQDAHRIRQKRLRGAALTADVIQTFQTANPTTPLFVTGDMNAFEFTDGYVDVTGILRGDSNPALNEYDLGFDDVATGTGVNGNIVDPPLEQALLALPPAQRYSFTFSGSAQVLDHGFLSRAAAARFEGIAYGRGNADAPVNFQFDVTPANLALRTSDHDAFVLYVNAADRPTVSGWSIFKDGFE